LHPKNFQEDQKMKQKRSIVIIVIALTVVALVAAFGWASFRAAYGQTGRSLQAEITRRLQQLPEFGQIQPISDPVDQAEFPYLFVEIARKDIFWTPVYGRAELEIKIAYASNGDVSFRYSEPPTFHNENQAPSIKRSGQYKFADVSWGIMSLPGYHDYLASQVATAILADLQNQAVIE
jgi:hypothetical protein